MATTSEIKTKSRGNSGRTSSDSDIPRSEKLEQLRTIIRGYGSLIVAYSGGVEVVNIDNGFGAGYTAATLIRAMTGPDV